MLALGPRGLSRGAPEAGELMHRLIVLGAAQVLDTCGLPVRGLMQPRPLGLLAALAAAGARGVTRDRLALLLWGETSDARARHRLADTLYLVNRAVGAEAVARVGKVSYLNPAVVTADVTDFLDAACAGKRDEAVAAYGGPFLEGFAVPDAPVFEEWLGEERHYLAGLYADALEGLGAAHDAEGDHTGALRQWRRLSAHDPLNSRIAIALARSMAAAGDRGNALKALAAHRKALRDELGMDEFPTLDQALEEIHHAPRAPRRLSSLVPRRRTPAGLDLGEGASERPAAGPKRRRVGTWAAAAAATTAVAWWLVAGRGLAHPGPRVTTSNLVPVSAEPGLESEPAISPDGKEVAYVAGPVGHARLVIRSTASGARGGEVRLSDTVPGTQSDPAWSADGEFVRFIACRAGSCRWMVVGRMGGAPRALEVPAGPLRRYAWAPDGTHAAFAAGDSILLHTLPGGLRRLVALHPGALRGLHSLAWSPDGKLIAYVAGEPGWRVSAGDSGSSIWVVPADGGRPSRITTAEHHDASPCWLDAGHLLFVSGRDGAREVYVVAVGRHGASGPPRAVPGVPDPRSISYSVQARRLAWSSPAAGRPEGDIWVTDLRR